MFQEASDAKPIEKLPPRVRNIVDALNADLPDFIKHDAEKTYVEAMFTQNIEIRNALPILRRIIGLYADAEKNFDMNTLINTYLKYDAKIPSYIESYEELKKTHSFITDPEAEALAEAAVMVAADLGLTWDDLRHPRLEENVHPQKQAGTNAIDSERNINLE